MFFCYLLRHLVSATAVVHPRGATGAFPLPSSPPRFPSEPIASVCCCTLWKPISGSSLNGETMCGSVWLKIKVINFVGPWGHLEGHSETGVQQEVYVPACWWGQTRLVEVLLRENTVTSNYKSRGQGDVHSCISHRQFDMASREAATRLYWFNNILFIFLNNIRESVELYINTVFSNFLCFSFHILTLSFSFPFCSFHSFSWSCNKYLSPRISNVQETFFPFPLNKILLALFFLTIIPTFSLSFRNRRIFCLF